MRDEKTIKRTGAEEQIFKSDAGKPMVALVPTEIIRNIAVIREYGINKYPIGGKDNYKQVSVERYRNSTYRHWLEYLDDPYGVDKESGLPHLYHLACNVAFLCEIEKGKFGERKDESCDFCKYVRCSTSEEPCRSCRHNQIDRFEENVE